MGGAHERASSWIASVSLVIACGGAGPSDVPSGSDTAVDDGGEPFVDTPDGGGVAFACDPWTQSCPAGEKCMPWADDDGDSWNATRCTPVAARPGAPGDACMVEGGPTSGVDDCALGAMCWEGTCIAMCGGSADAPQCEAPDHGCSITNGGALILCVPFCDPLQQDCPDGEACYPESRGFFCSSDASEDIGAFGDPCAYLNACDPGYWCAGASDVPGCTHEDGCCSAICDVADPSCPGAGQICEAFVPTGSPAGDHGLCVIAG